MKKARNIFFLSCKKASELIVKREVTKLSLIESLRLKMHVSVCEACNAFENQNKTIDEAMSKYLHSKKEDSETMSPESKKQIIDKIKNL